MAAGADSSAATRAATAVSPAGPGTGGSVPAVVLISGQPIPALGARQPHDRQTWDRGGSHVSARNRPGYSVGVGRRTGTRPGRRSCPALGQVRMDTAATRQPSAPGTKERTTDGRLEGCSRSGRATRGAVGTAGAHHPDAAAGGTGHGR